MKASKSSDAQIAFVLKQAEDGTPVGEVCRKAGISARPFTSGARDMPDCCRRR
ncbi:putative transposase [Rhizobium mongolense]|uniref:Transposase n=1 Tax=Rhizobium mongolense TaxID=57676 RepID=A0ABR6INB2_9HYPH|nr:putative transposase [Rhizobium mongolense]